MRNQTIITSRVSRDGNLIKTVCRSLSRPFKRITTLQRTVITALMICLLALAGPGMFASTTSKSRLAFAESETKKSFETLKVLAGSWEGPVTSTPNVPAMVGKIARVSLRVTSSGNALMHDLTMSGLRDNPLTIFYLEEDRLQLTHYCDAGNRPRMTGKVSPDGKIIEFDFLDLAGGDHRGHMHNVVITLIDANHHTEDWSYMMPGHKTMRAHFDLKRTK